MRQWHLIVLIIRFLVELLTVAAAFWIGWSAHTTMRILLGPLACAATVSLWAVFIAPRSRRRLADPARFCAETALFLAVATGLTALANAGVGIAWALLSVGSAALVRFVDETQMSRIGAARTEKGGRP